MYFNKPIGRKYYDDHFLRKCYEDSILKFIASKSDAVGAARGAQLLLPLLRR